MTPPPAFSAEGGVFNKDDTMGEFLLMARMLNSFITDAKKNQVMKQRQVVG